MPFTLSHPAAVLPLRRFGRWRGDFTALVIGSLSPDFPYYVPGLQLPSMHTLAASLWFCLPAGWLVLAGFEAVKQPLCSLLPQPHRAALMPLALRRRDWNWRALLIGSGSLLLGAWSHQLWDLFTHASRGGADYLPWLLDDIPLGGDTLPLYKMLQWLSGAAGAAVLAAAYRRWLRRQPAVAAAPGRRPWLLLTALGLAASGAALPFALNAALDFGGCRFCRAFLFEEWVHAADLFLGLLLLSALAAQCQRSGAT